MISPYYRVQWACQGSSCGFIVFAIATLIVAWTGIVSNLMGTSSSTTIYDDGD